jgi:nicotinamidase-related amidase
MKLGAESHSPEPSASASPNSLRSVDRFSTSNTLLAPLADELVLPKSSSSPFNSTNLDYLLRNIGITELVVAGLLTDQCIDHTVKDAADRGYTVTCCEANYGGYQAIMRDFRSGAWIAATEMRKDGSADGY